jgi:hypothetical protein
MSGATYARQAPLLIKGLRFQMSFLQQRLAAVTDVTANLIAQLSELNELRERLRKAQLSARRTRRTGNRKRARI